MLEYNSDQILKVIHRSVSKIIWKEFALLIFNMVVTKNSIVGKII